MERKSAIINLGHGLKAIVDLEDLPRLSKSRWFAEKRTDTYYAQRHHVENGKNKKIYMHQEVLEAIPEGKEIDHNDGNGLNNTKENLRVCTHAENIRAARKRDTKCSSKYKGVTWSKERKKWMVRISHLDGTRKFLGSFESELDAAKAYMKLLWRCSVSSRH